jgi:hypothetical protein
VVIRQGITGGSEWCLKLFTYASAQRFAEPVKLSQETDNGGITYVALILRVIDTQKSISRHPCSRCYQPA